MFYVYILKGSSNPLFYIGFTTNLNQRLEQHNNHSNPSTIKSENWQLVYLEGYQYENVARNRERMLKHYGKAWQAIKKRISEVENSI
jgi:putative endonuclease